MASISEDCDFTDFSLESKDGAKFPVHRNVLAAQSSVLRRMFLNPMEERKKASVQLKYKTATVEKLSKFFYKREIEEEEEEENLRSFLEFAQQYDLPHLKEEVEELAKRKLTVENMVDMFLHSAEVLKEAAESLIRANRLMVKEDLDELLEKLDRDQAKMILSICIV